ncbi:hypothetical protein SPOA0203 (plasmid) [Ruegeria pomeroyi DSS-3]|uniref:Orc1-like AAA ATPase domain-containing protein n=2 Tax=Ruegeria pomeroyi TaxID=89184 RepID=Q5LL26_RUEPO|nr:hypothetical protein [Ruegeria pomeroyi]AAV97337.1 hypothetical protein SPOA0203 [Ruegeria pomeroyi DSS-3]NVK96809.1 hypothetical protein [Ruegeria pomeroyi]NVL02477.1 hypothetical protein [Ruegeria pomeroyi]HCE71343.1 hypothetical protein [Ruegeria sp.]
MRQALIDLAQELSAVCGCYEPDALCDALGVEDRPDLRHDVLGALSRGVTEVLCPVPEASPRYGWMLAPDPRAAALRRFLTRAQLDQALELAPTPWQDDLFGQVLHQLLAGAQVEVARPKGSDNETRLLTHLRHNAAILDAVQFARAVPALDARALETLESEAKRQIQEVQKWRDLVIVLPRRHFGYDNIRRRLSHFLRGKTKDTRPLLLTGTGGIGKSAVLARLLQDWQTRRDAPITVILDFDRPQLKTGAPFQIAREILNQIAVGVTRTLDPPEAAANVSKQLRMRRAMLSSTDLMGEVRDHGAQADFLESQLPGWFRGDWTHGLRSQPIALAFDSFEAVDRQGGEVVRLILAVEEQFRRELPGLRCVLSGRAEPLEGEELDDRFGPSSRRITLDGLSVEAGAQLIEEEDRRLSEEDQQRKGIDRPPVLTDETLRRTVSRLLKGHPLALLIFVKYARTHDGDIADLIADLEEDGAGAFRSEFAHRFLYERILDRIDDPELRSLAHPGLVLRQINTDLIRFVLAVPCLGLPEGTVLPEGRAEALRKKLENEYWLVDPGEPPFDLRHRADVRRMMVAGLFAGPREADTAADHKRKARLREDALAVCSAARDYFRLGPPDGSDEGARQRWQAMDPEMRNLHALYYEAFLSPRDVPEFDAQTARALDLSLGEDLETLPAAWRARVNVLLGRVLSKEEAFDLGDDLRELAEKQEFTSAAQHGLSTADEDFTTVSEASESRAGDPLGVRAHEDVYRPDGSDWRSASRLSRDIQRAFAAARFAEVADLAPRYFEALEFRSNKEIAEDHADAMQRGYWRHPMWQCLLVAGSGVETSAMAQAASVFLDSADHQRALPGVIAFIAQQTDPMQRHKELDVLQGADFKSYVDAYRMSGSILDGWLGRKTALMASGRGVPLSGKPISRSPRALSLAAGRAGRAEEEFGALFEAAPDLAGRLEKFWAHGAPGISDITDLYRQFGEEEDLTRLLASEALPQTDLAFRMFRGLNPDLYPPLRRILEEQEGEVVLRLAEALAQRARHWPEELRMSALSGYSRNQSATLVEVADQCGELGTLCACLAEFDSRAGTVREMFDSLSAWFFPFARDLEI